MCICRCVSIPAAAAKIFTAFFVGDLFECLKFRVLHATRNERVPKKTIKTRKSANTHTQTKQILNQK